MTFPLNGIPKRRQSVDKGDKCMVFIDTRTMNF